MRVEFAPVDRPRKISTFKTRVVRRLESGKDGAPFHLVWWAATGVRNRDAKFPEILKTKKQKRRKKNFFFWNFGNILKFTSAKVIQESFEGYRHRSTTSFFASFCSIMFKYLLYLFFFTLAFFCFYARGDGGTLHPTKCCIGLTITVNLQPPFAYYAYDGAVAEAQLRVRFKSHGFRWLRARINREICDRWHIQMGLFTCIHTL